VEYLRTNARGAHLFHDYAWGGYLIWHAPEVPVFIDGRADIFEQRGVFHDYLQIMYLRDTFGALDRYQVDWVLIRPDAGVAYLLEHSSSWTVQYRDQNSILFRRNAARQPS
jgi:hypothetical protein